MITETSLIKLFIQMISGNGTVTADVLLSSDAEEPLLSTTDTANNELVTELQKRTKEYVIRFSAKDVSDCV
jgi:hypothetical protein